MNECIYLFVCVCNASYHHKIPLSSLFSLSFSLFLSFFLSLSLSPSPSLYCTSAAFESVMPPMELGSFVALDRAKKTAQLQVNKQQWREGGEDVAISYDRNHLFFIIHVVEATNNFL